MRNKIARVATKFLKKSSENLEIHIYDFDMTLFRSPEAPKWWDKKSYGQWHSHQSSLGEPFLEVKAPSSYWITNVVRRAKSSTQDLNVWSVMCTGRIDIVPIGYRVAELLKQAGLDFDNVFLNGTGAKTPKYKQQVLIGLLKKFPNVKKVQMWEDTKENLDAIEAICNKVGVEFEGHLIAVSEIGSDHISEDEYLEFIKEEVPANEFSKLFKKILKRRTKNEQKSL